MSTEETGFAPEPDLPWPPWLEGLSDGERIPAIVEAVAACYGSQHDGPDGAQHCTVLKAVQFLELLLATEATARAARDVIAGLPARWRSGAAEVARSATGPTHADGVSRAEARTLAGCADELETALLGLPAPADVPEPPLPEGIYGRVELPGYRNHTGWITEETRYGVQMAVVRDWDARVVAEVAPGPLCQLVHLPTPLKRPEPPEDLLVLPAGEGCGCGPYEECDQCDGSVPF